MNTESSRDSSLFRRLRSGWPVLVLLLLAVPLAYVLLTKSASLPVPQAADAFLEAQRQAMKPEYQSELNDLGPIPRYTLDVSIDPGTGEYSGLVQIEFTNQTGSCLSEVLLRLYANAPTIYAGQLVVQSVSVDGRHLDVIDASPTAVRVPFSICLGPQDQVTLEVAFEGRIPPASITGYGIHGSAPAGVALTGWYPMLALPAGAAEQYAVPTVGDAVVAGVSLIEASVEVPQGFSIIATGSVLSSRERARQRIVTGPVRELALVAWEGPPPASRMVAGVRIRYFPAAENEMAITAGRGLELASHIFQDYQDQFGPYPYSQVDIVEWPVSIGGYEFPGLVFIDDALRAGAEHDLEFLLAHELAHQWWYGIVGNDQVNEPWLDESLANYSVVRYLDRRSGGQAGEALLQDWHERYGMRDNQDPVVNSPATEFGSWDPYRRTVYIHGALFLAELEGQMGEERFLSFLREYASRNRYGIATSSNFFDLAQESSDVELSALISDWFSPDLAP